MKLKTSISLEEETVAALDREAGGTTNRSRLIEQAILEFLDRRRRAARDARDLHRINRNAQQLNDEMADVLDYQVKLCGEATCSGFATRAATPTDRACSRWSADRL